MPALLTHYLCGDAVHKSINISEITDTVSKYRRLFNLGTQGPDIFFYHNAWPWAEGESLSKVGSRLHDEKVKDFFKYALTAIDKAQGAAKEMLLAYVYGYACHYSLDIHAHPYIFYKSGFAVDDSEDKKKYDAFHRRLEAELDAIMAKEILKKSPHEIKSHELITINREESLVIAEMYCYIFQNIFNLKIPAEAIQRAAIDMAAVTKAFRDPLGMKKLMVAFIEKRMKKYNLISSMIYPLRIEEGLEHLNLNHYPWYYPWDISSPQYSSFMDLFNEAVAEAKIMCESIYDYIDVNIDMIEALGVLGNRSFSSGLDCDETAEFKYCDLMYK